MLLSDDSNIEITNYISTPSPFHNYWCLRLMYMINKYLIDVTYYYIYSKTFLFDVCTTNNELLNKSKIEETVNII